MSIPPRRTAIAAVTITALVASVVASAPASAGLLTTAAPVVVAGPSLFSSCPVFDPTPFGANSETEALLAVNPTDQRNLVAIWQQDRYVSGSSRGIAVGISRDAGRTWTQVPVPSLSCPNLPGRTTNPWIGFAANGDLYATATVSSANSDVLVAKSTDGGFTWSPATTLITGPRSATFNDKQTTTADPREPDRVYAVWNRRTFATNQHDIMFARTTDGGQTWEPARSIHAPQPGAGTVGSQIVVLRDGTLLNLFFVNDLPIGSPPAPVPTDHIRVIRSTDQGQTWSPPVTIADVRLNIPLLPDSGVLLVAPGLVPDVAVDPITGAIYAVWGDASLGTSGSAVGLSASYDNGLTWTTPQRINQTPDSPPAGSGQAFLPQVDVAYNGTVAVTYYDFRNNTAEAGNTTDYWMTTCWGPRCGRGTGHWDERHLAGPFDVGTAVSSFGGAFVGTYVGLTHRIGSFLATFVMTTGDPTNPQDVYVSSTPSLPFDL
jgi:hypothetical protein